MMPALEGEAMEQQPCFRVGQVFDMYQKLINTLVDILLPAEQDAGFGNKKHGHVKGVVPNLSSFAWPETDMLVAPSPARGIWYTA